MPQPLRAKGGVGGKEEDGQRQGGCRGGHPHLEGEGQGDVAVRCDGEGLAGDVGGAGLPIGRRHVKVPVDEEGDGCQGQVSLVRQQLKERTFID